MVGERTELLLVSVRTKMAKIVLYNVAKKQRCIAKFDVIVAPFVVYSVQFFIPK